MSFKVFTKIFDLDPKKVEEFIIELTKSKFRFDNKEDEEQWWKDFTLKIKWHPTCNQFYVFTDPVLEHKHSENEIIPEIVKEQFPCYDATDIFKFKGRDISLNEYLWHQFDHYHYNFYEIYALMTGETEIWRVGYYNEDEELELYYDGVYNKEYITVIKTKSGKWFIQEWTKKDNDYEEIRKELPEELLTYIKTLDPKEVELR